jgi:UDP-N-acetylglucosamine--N-acetylmuramyl-(pentapeptide) pyrophosphoryl-undecaprenol N-acetylglucosamine transferase
VRLLICAGGTGGGVYPALSVLKMLENELRAVLWVGSKGGMEADLVTRAGVPFTEIPAAGVHGVGLRALPGNLFRLAQGTLAARRILSEFKPDVIFFTGGYVAAPVAVAGRNYPILLYVPDIEPGLALRFLSRFASTIALTSEDSRRFFHNQARIKVTGYPTRPELGNWTRDAARKHFNLSDGPVLLISGGSKGARTINQPVFENLPELLGLAQVIHLTGSQDKAEAESALEALPENLKVRYQLFDYLHEDMGAALAAADLAITRAGASTLGEYPLAGLPAILVPYQYAWRYQKVNADYLERQGAAVVLEADQLASQLMPTLQALFGAPERLQEMQQAMHSLARPDAAGQVAGLLQELAGTTSRGGKGDKTW